MKKKRESRRRYFASPTMRHPVPPSPYTGQFAAGVNNTNLKGWSAVVETNLTGTFNVTKAVYDKYMQDHGGAVVNITVCNRNGFAGMAHSGAARAGVENLSMSLTMEWAADGVRVRVRGDCDWRTI